MLKYVFAAAAVCLLAVSIAAGSPAYAKGKSRSGAVACANKFCTRDAPGAKSCRRFDKRANVSRCFITRAAAHYGQSKAQALAISYRESRWNPHATNSSSGAAGLFQFMPVTWQHTPYRKHSPYQPRWASLAAMWLWSKGGYHHWSL
ncbi:MAG: Transglycosylase domain [Betaproteobacteria bacterium]|jgi:hypothetical protein|nr:Transglycosylase domain [Betaproteobacteria bacterium]